MSTNIFIRFMLTGLLAVGVTPSFASDDSKGDFATVNNEQYLKECGSCHIAYPPDALPERSWRKLMDGLNKHFGENAELADTERNAISDYLVKNAAEHSRHKRATKMHNSIAKDETPLRLSEVPYFVKEHRKVINKTRNNDKVKISQCDSCHQKARSGSYAEGEINVPGIGAWKD